jgi:predicted N-acetyltransferase YhbS
MSDSASETTFFCGVPAPEDVDGILALQDANQIERGGSLSARFPREWFLQAMANAALLVARRDGVVIGYVAFTSRQLQAHVPIIQAMLQAYDHPGAYLHGPLCVAATERRRGVAQALLQAQRQQCGHAPLQSFIREDNVASRAAHRAAGLREAATFSLGGARYVVVVG